MENEINQFAIVTFVLFIIVVIIMGLNFLNIAFKSTYETIVYEAIEKTEEVKILNANNFENFEKEISKAILFNSKENTMREIKLESNSKIVFDLEETEEPYISLKYKVVVNKKTKEAKQISSGIEITEDCEVLTKKDLAILHSGVVPVIVPMPNRQSNEKPESEYNSLKYDGFIPEKNARIKIIEEIVHYPKNYFE